MQKNSLMTLYMLIILYFAYSYAIEYDASKYAFVQMTSPVADHPISHATDLDLNTYFQTDADRNQSFVQFDFGDEVKVEKIYLWLADNSNQSGPIYVYVANEVNLNYDRTNLFYQIDNYKHNQFINCHLSYFSYISGRYIIISNENENARLRISELAIIINDIDFVVTTFGHVQQSMIHLGQPASNALDGKIDTCIHTADNYGDRKKAGWWSVDLLQEYTVNSIEINEAYSEPAFRGFYNIYISINDSIINNSLVTNEENLCVDFKQRIDRFYSNYMTLTCMRPIEGRYLVVVRTTEYIDYHHNRPDVLNFCEIKVHALRQYDIYKWPESNITKLTTPIKDTSVVATIDFLTENASKCEKEKIVIGVVVAVLLLILCLIIGLLCKHVLDKKRQKMKQFKEPEYDNRNKETSVVYESMKKPEDHVYDGLEI